MANVNVYPFIDVGYYSLNQLWDSGVSDPQK